MNTSALFETLGGWTRYQNSVCRMVETQEYAGTTSLVDDLEEQAILEQLLDDYKPNYANNTQTLHYLISTPFRYPPLKYGSRFGSLTEPSFFYASESVQTCLAEAAFYRFYLLDGTDVPFPDKIQSQHSLFFVQVLSNKATDLCQITDEAIQAQLTDPQSYAITQKLGQYVRQQGGDLIRYYSARCPSSGINVAIDNHTVIQSDTPQNKVEYICQIEPDTGIIRFSQPRQFPVTFNKSQFLVEGKLPLLA